MRFRSFCFVLFTTFLFAGQAAAETQEQNQDEKYRLKVGRLLKKTFLDPTTYAPAGLYFTAAKLDWDSSRPFFIHGWKESNPNYTISGKPNDWPISHAAGNRKMIFRETLPLLGISALTNFGLNALEDIATHRDPKRKKFNKFIFTVTKIGLAGFSSYIWSKPNFHQWQKNRRIARELGYIP